MGLISRVSSRTYRKHDCFPPTPRQSLAPRRRLGRKIQPRPIPTHQLSNPLQKLPPNSNPRTLTLQRQKPRNVHLDVAGNEVYSDITDVHLARHDASSIVICYDVTNKSSLTSLKRWMNHWRSYDKARSQHTGLLPVAIVGLKSDLTSRRLVTSKQGENLVQKLKTQSGLKNIKYFEASCKKPNTAVEVFNWLGDSILKL